MYEKLLYNRLPDHVEHTFNVILCGFPKAHSTQHALFIFLQSWQVCIFAGNNTLYSVGKNIENVISELETDLVGVMAWFKIKSLKDNPDKFQFIVLGNEDERSLNIHINNAKIKNPNEVTILGIKINKNLTFKKHISEI